MNEVRTRRHSSFPSFGSAARIASRTRRSIQRRVALQFEFRLPSPPSPNTMTAREASYSRVLPTRHSHFSLPRPATLHLRHPVRHHPRLRPRRRNMIVRDPETVHLLPAVRPPLARPDHDRMAIRLFAQVKVHMAHPKLRRSVSVTPRFENISRFILAIGGQLWPI